ncbi:hypothetical protein MMC13_003264 [Lambiella insularis]|nr:hypothetical protein [Lambiella insularis]
MEEEDHELWEAPEDTCLSEPPTSPFTPDDEYERHEAAAPVLTPPQMALSAAKFTLKKADSYATDLEAEEETPAEALDTEAEAWYRSHFKEERQRLKEEDEPAYIVPALHQTNALGKPLVLNDG